MDSKQRNSSFELLRLILMWGIIIHHCIVHGLGLKNLSDSYEGLMLIQQGDMPMLILANCLVIPAVNCFILLSGYFGIRTSYTKLANVLFAMFFYTVILAVIPYAAIGEFKRMIISILFLSHSPYWFMIDYLFLMMLAPMINKVYEKNSKYLKHLTVGLLVISCYFGFIWGDRVNVDGYTLIQFITIYALGRFLANRNICWKRYKSLFGWIACGSIIASVMYVFWILNMNNFAWRMTYYNNPLLIVASVCIFMVFKSISFQSRLVNKMAVSALSIYLVQSSRLGESLLYGRIYSLYKYTGGGILMCLMFISVGIVIVSILIDQIRLWVYDKLFAKISWQRYQ